MRSISLAVAALALSSGMAFAAAHESPAPVVPSEDGAYLVNQDQMTLYTFDKDSEGMSNCYDDCAAKWPPVLSDAEMALPDGYSLVMRKDGTSQVAYKGMPLYGWFKDAKPGDMTGDGVKGVWHVARP